MVIGVISTSASDLGVVGLTALRQVDPTLNGTGVRVTQVEAPYYTGLTPPYAFEVVPVFVGQPVSLFTYYSGLGTATSYPNPVGTNSDHAVSVGGNFYGPANGLATNISHVDNYEASFFYNSKISVGAAIPARVVNQSFNFLSAGQAAIETAYDNYVVSHKTLFLTGAGNSGSINTNPPATCYNGLAVAVSDGSSAVGPTSDGRCKPDLTSPGSGATSFSTPHVAGAAAILLQAAIRGDGGANSALATNVIATKALLLNGAVKPADWTNGTATPLDARYGAGVLHVFNSWMQLHGGQHGPVQSSTNTSGSAHPPGNNATNEPSLTGWDYNTTMSTSATQDKINHYYFHLTGSNAYTLTSTLVWNRQSGKTTVNNLDLFLFNTANSNLVLASTSVVDNVEHLFSPQLAPGRYDLQVLKRGSSTQISAAETYALAFEFFSVPLNLVSSNGSITLSWTNTTGGFRLVSTTNVGASASWATVNAPVSLVNNQNTVTLPVAGVNQFFRLQRP